MHQTTIQTRDNVHEHLLQLIHRVYRAGNGRSLPIQTHTALHRLFLRLGVDLLHPDRHNRQYLFILQIDIFGLFQEQNFVDTSGRL
jgi:hypothetical protein